MTNKQFAEENAGKTCMFYNNTGVVVGWHKFYPMLIAVSVSPDCRVFPDYSVNERIELFEKTADIPYERIAFVRKDKMEVGN